MTRQSNTVPDIAAVARWLTARGLYVFAVDHPGLLVCAGAHHPKQPCDGKRGKHPCGKWSRDATTDPDAITVVLSRGLRNLGIACGPSRLLVIDEDRRDAFAAYAADAGQKVPGTFAVNTGKGRHYYFWQPEDAPLGNSPGALAGRGIDVRGAAGRGGYVVAPGSIHETGVVYTPVDSTAPILPAPGWLVTALRDPRPAIPAAREGGTRRQVSGGRPFKVLTGLVQTVLDATPGTDRNSRLYWAGCRMYEHADHGLFAPAAGRGALLEAARQVGLPDGEAERTLDSARSMTAGGGR